MARSNATPASRTRPRAHPAHPGPRHRPALFARFGGLTTLRHDFPLVLVAGDDGPYAEPLSARVDTLLVQLAPAGSAGERLRRAVLGLEREIRTEVSRRGGGPLESAWDAAARRLIRRGEALAQDLDQARGRMPLAGDLIDCDAAAPARFVRHAWRRVNERRRRELLGSIERLETDLGGMVRADFLRSAAGRDAAALRAGVGTANRSLFDFEAMERLLRRPSGHSGFSDARRRRIAATLSTLQERRLFGSGSDDDFVFASVQAALKAYEARLPAVGRMLRAIALAELETRGLVLGPEREARLRAVAAGRALPEELRLFPDSLVRLDVGDADRSLADALSALGSGVPFKVLVAIDDPFGLGGHLAEVAMGLGDVFVLQTAASHLYAARDSVLAALEYRGPALLSVYTPPARLTAGRAGIPGYLASAAAIESRALPAFTYDPSAGSSWRERLSLHHNPQAEQPWPRHSLTYSDATMQRVAEEVAFTAADFALCDPRWATHLSPPTADAAEAGLVPIDAWLADRTDATSAGSPFVFALADEGGTLEKLVVDARLAQAVRLRSQAWSRLRELDALKLERAVPTTTAVAEEVAVPAPAGAAPVESDDDGADAAPVSADSGADVVIPAPGGDDPYVETPRCTSCNECTSVNDRMFAYDSNRQAFIADPDAGTYRDLVEAAERCQVAIIHPGKPRNPNEPDLEGLQQRAAAVA